MAIGRTWSTGSKHLQLVENGLVFVPNTRILGRKRVLVPNDIMTPSKLSPLLFSTKPRARKQCTQSLISLPQDILVRILSKVNHSDLKHLILVSKSIQEASLIARELHFDFSTPPTKPISNKYRNLGNEDSEEAPNAPKQHKVAKSRIDRGKLTGVSVALFTSPDKGLPKKD